MQFEEFDKKIVEAADNHHPAYNEQAWAKMEKLLNKHMPVKKDRRRGMLFFLLFLGLLTGGAGLYYFTGHGSTKPSASIQSNESLKSPSGSDASANSAGSGQSPVSAPGDAASGNTVAGQTTLPAAKDQFITETNHKLHSADQPVTADPAVTGTINAKLLKQTYAHAVQDAFNAELKKSSGASVKQVQKNNGSSMSGELPDISNGQPVRDHTDKNTLTKNVPAPVYQGNISKDQQPMQQATVNVPVHTAEADNNKSITKKESGLSVRPDIAAVTAAVSARSKGSAVKSTFFIALSGGPDMSVIGVSNTGRMKLVGGAGLGYTVKGKFTLRTGFYSARKVYTASPDEYHPPSSFWNYYPNLQKVDADCRVYEIPLLFSYNFAKKGNSNWFAGTGISSYLMKRETYNYFYKTMAGVNTSRKYTLLDQNHHYFSVLTLSAGYQRSLGKNLFISAEPYIKIPLSGIGYGRINLNSAGMLFTAGWVPFHAKKGTSKLHEGKRSNLSVQSSD